MLARSNLTSQCLDGVCKAGSDLFVGQRTVLEARVGVRDGELEIQDPRADRRQHLPELGLCRNRAEGAGAGADHGHRLVPQNVRSDRARDPVDGIFQLS